jgi:hypothetical protein
MKTSLAKFIGFLLIAMSGCRAASSGSDMKMAQTYRVSIPHFVVEFQIPPELERGYGPFKTEVLFENPPNPRFTFSFGDGVYRKQVGGFYLGAKRDFNDWDLTAEIYIIKSDRNQHPMRSAEDLAKFARNILAEKYALADGKVVDDLGSITIEKMGSHDVVVATRADPYRDRTIRLKDTKGEYTDQELKESPYQIYYVRLDDEVTVSIHVSHDNEKKLSPKWYAENHARVAKIIESMKVEPKKNDNQ